MSLIIRGGDQPPEVEPFAAAALEAVRGGLALRLQVGVSSCEVGGDLAEALLTLLSTVAGGQPAEVAPLPLVLLPRQAAQLLEVPLETVLDLVQRGALPASDAGAGMSIPIGPVLDERDRRHGDREQALDEMVRLSEELGLYDE
jgi:hypothetical protein